MKNVIESYNGVSVWRFKGLNLLLNRYCYLVISEKQSGHWFRCMALQKRQVRFSPKRIIGTDRAFGRANRTKPEEPFHSSIPRVAMKEFDEESGFVCLARATTMDRYFLQDAT